MVDWKKVESVEFLEHEVYPTVEPEEILDGTLPEEILNDN